MAAKAVQDSLSLQIVTYLSLSLFLPLSLCLSVHLLHNYSITTGTINVCKFNTEWCMHDIIELANNDDYLWSTILDVCVCLSLQHQHELIFQNSTIIANFV